MARDKRRNSTQVADAFFEAAHVELEVVAYTEGSRIFQQGDEAGSVMFVREGTVKLSVVSTRGKEAVLGLLEPGAFFGEGCLAGQSRRMATATTLTHATITIVEKDEMARRLHEHSTFSESFLSHILTRNIRIEQDLVDQLFNSSEKRLARALLLLARYGDDERPQFVVPHVSQELLAEMVGTTRSRVNFFMNKFRKLGFIEYNGKLRVNRSLLTVVLHD